MMDCKNLSSIVLVCVCLVCCFSGILAQEQAEEATGSEFSLQEKRWAIQWINERLSLLMEDGLIKRIKCNEDDENYEVFVSSSWGFLTLEEKKVFLGDFSRAREITRHSPYLTVRNDDTGEVLAKVNKWGILVFDESGEYFAPRGDSEKSFHYGAPSPIPSPLNGED